jgi:catechol 2,3-dioxygenase-like lactoylglutathione lyase family enzyme
MDTVSYVMANATSTQTRFEAITPRFPVADVETALAYYLDKLGFSLGWKWGSPLTHANVCRDAISLDLISMPPESRGTAMAYVAVAGVDAYYEALTARGVDASAIGDRDYGMRDFEVVDPDGNRLAFGEPLND